MFSTIKCVPIKKLFNTTSILKKCTVSLGLTLAASAAWAAQMADVIVPKDVFEDYTLFLDGRDPISITDFSGEKSSRDVVELILVKQAIKRSGADFKVKFVPVVDGDNAATEIMQKLTAGEVVAAGTSIWRSDLVSRHDELFITTAIINRGEFEAGFYTHPENSKAMKANTREKIRRLSGVSSETWTIDWKTLSSLDLRPLKNTPSWGEMVRQVSAKETDFLLAPFQAGENMGLSVGDDLVLLPIPDIKIGLDGSRHLAVSRKHAMGGEFNAALHLGMLRLKGDGIVRQAYSQSGFFNANVRDWELVTARGTVFGN